MDIQMGGEMNELMNTKMCSPMMIYLAVLVSSALSVYITRTNLKRHNTTKMDNLYNMYSLNELKFMIVFGLVLYGLCQYNKSTLAWVFLIFPVIYLLIQNLIIHIHISSAVQTAPKEIDVSNYQIQQMNQLGGSQVIPQDTHQQQKQIMVPPIQKNLEMPISSSISQALGGGGTMGGGTMGGGTMGGNVMGSNISGSEVGSSGSMGNYAYF